MKGKNPITYAHSGAFKAKKKKNHPYLKTEAMELHKGHIVAPLQKQVLMMLLMSLTASKCRIEAI